jgi:hypothetical protein
MNKRTKELRSIIEQSKKAIVWTKREIAQKEFTIRGRRTIIKMAQRKLRYLETGR